MKRSIVVVDDVSPDGCAEPAARILKRHGDAEIVSVSEFVKDGGFAYDLGRGLLIRDAAAFDAFRTRATEVRVLNRAVEMSPQTCRAFLAKDSKQSAEALPIRFVMAALATLLNEVRDVWGRPGRYSSVGNLLPLDLQWYEFKVRRSDIGVPRYAYSNPEAKSVEFKRPVWTDAYDLYNWAVSATPEFADLHPFVVERPAGIPATVYFVGDAIAAFSMLRDSEIDAPTMARFNDCVRTLRDAFKAAVGEALFFVDGDEIIFASFSHYLRTSMQHEKFEDTLERGLTEWLGREVREVAYS